MLRFSQDEVAEGSVQVAAEESLVVASIDSREVEVASTRGSSSNGQVEDAIAKDHSSSLSEELLASAASEGGADEIFSDEEDEQKAYTCCCFMTWMWFGHSIKSRLRRRRKSKQSMVHLSKGAPQENRENHSSKTSHSSQQQSKKRSSTWKYDRAGCVRALQSHSWKNGLLCITENRLADLDDIAQESDFQRALVVWRNRSGETIFHVLCRVGASDTLSILLNHLDQQSKSLMINRATDRERGFLPLHTAAASANATVIRLLIQHGAVVHAVHDRYGLTPLHRAAISSSPQASECCQILLDAGASPFIRDNAGYTAWHKGCFHASLESLKVMLQYILDHNLRDQLGMCDRIGVDSKRSFHIVSTYGTKNIPEIVSILSQYPDIFNIDARADGGVTALHDASVIGNVIALDALIANGANVNAVNDNMETPLHVAVQANQPRICDLLLQNTRVNVAQKDKSGNTPRMAAIEENRFEILELFDNYGRETAEAPSQRRNRRLIPSFLESLSRSSITSSQGA